MKPKVISLKKKNFKVKTGAWNRGIKSKEIYKLPKSKK